MGQIPSYLIIELQKQQKFVWIYKAKEKKEIVNEKTKFEKFKNIRVRWGGKEIY